MVTRRSVLFGGFALGLYGDTPVSKLRNRRADAKPITGAEREQRVERAQRLMIEQKIGSICLTGGTSLEYFAGVRWGGGERLFAMVIPARGDPFFVAPAFEEGRAREQVRRAQVFTWQEDESPYALMASALKERGLATGRLGMEETVKFVFADGIASALRAATVVSATPITAGCRAVKSSAELALMRLANSVTLEAYKAAWESLKPGMTTRDFTGLIGAAYQALGFPGFASAQVDAYSALPHGSSQPQVIHEGSLVLIDDGCRVEGYNSDISRSFVIGRPTDEMKRVFDVVHRAQSAALAAARPGVACGAVDDAARKVIVDAGYGPDYKYFTHRLGHGIGMDGHEWPYLVRGNKLALRPGMTFSDEPGVYLPGKFGIRLEDDMYVTEDGAALFTPQSPSLELPFG